MIVASKPHDEARRLHTLRAYDILDTEKDVAFDRLVSLAATLFEVPIAFMSLVDEDRVWLKSAHGVPQGESSRDVAFCSHTILQVHPLVVSDLHEDARFHDNPNVTGAPFVRFYAGAPLQAPDGQRVGALCLLDRKPRELTPQQVQVLQDLAAVVINQLELRAARRAIVDEARELQAVLNGFPVSVVVVADRTIRFANDAAHAMFRFPPGEMNGIPQSTLVHPDELAQSYQTASEIVQPDRAPRAVRRRVLTRDGEERVVVGMAGRLTWQGTPSVMIALRDVTEEERMIERREKEHARVTSELGVMLTAFDVLPDGIVLYDAEYRSVYANKAIGNMLGLRADEMKGWTPEDTLRHVSTLAESPDALVHASKNVRAPTDKPGSVNVFKLAKPRPRVLRRGFYPLPSETHRWMAVWNDITDEAQQIEKRHEEARTDALTQLPNRRAAESKIARARLSAEPLSVAIFDVDHFKRVNDVHGHGAGDEVLRQVAAALACTVRGGDVVSRWGGEEFLAVIHSDLAGAIAVAERARAAVASLQTPAGPVTISAGVAQFTDEANAVEQADRMLYEAKRAGRNRVLGASPAGEHGDQ